MKIFKRYYNFCFLGILGVLTIVIFYSICYVSNPFLTVAFLDVGQGDAIFIKAPGGQELLIDGGANNKVLRELGRVMPFYDRSISAVLMTHADQDHIGGLVEVLKRYQVDVLFRTNTVSSSAVYAELEKIVKEKNIKEEIITQAKIVNLGGGVELDILFPIQDTAGWETNESSIVSHLIYGGNSFLLTGDSPQIIEKYLVGKYGSLLKSDVLKAGHHGSKTSSAELFVGTVSPELTVILASLNNRYGHPSPETIDILNRFQSQILETSNQGNIIFKTDGQNLILVKD